MKNAFSELLIRWYLIHKRDLPWRDTTDAYRIWLSEIILQQTRVDQGLSYYHKFIDLFPTVQHLAAAHEEEVLKAWQGLGYYSRASNLHATARWVVQQAGGIFPTSYHSLIELKGIGPYTAAAIASFSSGESVPVIDGNVMRVLARLHGVYVPIDSVSGKKRMATLAEDAIRGSNAAMHNQAMMEFGALLCTPQRPACHNCPFAQRCVARAEGTVSSLPAKAKKTVVKPLYLYYFVVSTHEGEIIFFRKREGHSIWKGLYDFPCIEAEAARSLPEVVTEFLEQQGMQKGSTVGNPGNEFTHLLSHRKITAFFIPVKAPPGWKAPKDWKPFGTGDLDKPGVPRLIDKYLSTRHILHN
jgi:A/G-specific adenine glycosylase